MSTSKQPLRRRAMTVAGGIALIGTMGAGLAGTASAASTSDASSILAKIKYCESGGNYQAQNASSSASGAYQFTTSTWKSLSAAKGYATAASAPASVQDAAARELYAKYGTSPWAASSSCWSTLSSVPTTSSSSSTATTTSATSTSTTSSNTTKAASKPAPAKVGSVKGHGPHSGKPHKPGKPRGQHKPSAHDKKHAPKGAHAPHHAARKHVNKPAHPLKPAPKAA